MSNSPLSPRLAPSSPTPVIGMFDMARFEQLKATGDLPSPKGSALAIIRLTQRDDLSISELTHVVRTDPAFVGRLIKTANSAQANTRRPIVSIHDALTVLGIPAVRTLALSFSLLSGYRSGNCRNFDYQRYWSQSLVRAVAMQALALRLRMCTPDEAFSVGLLCDVGELALATTFPDDYSRILGQFQVDNSVSVIELERAAFAMTAGELSTAMLMDWGFPKTFTEPVYHHDDPDHSGFVEGSRQDLIAHSLVLSKHVADVCLAADSERRSMMPMLFLLGSRLSIEADSLTGLCDRIASEWGDWGALLNVSASRVPPFDELSRPPDAPAMSGVIEEGGHRMRILVVDDDGSMRAMLKALLGANGHEVFEASNGQQGFEMALDLRPHLMIVDWMMPEMTGIELTRALRQTKIGRSIYVLILTGLEDDEKLVEAFESGVDDFMSKPLKPRILQARLRAGHRVVQLQNEIERDREEIRKFAAELAVTNRRLQEVALTDSLTGFPNRRYAMERIAQEWSAGDRTKRPLSCMMVDVDNFKTINDTYGHDVGDSVLKQAAAALKTGLRTQDVVCRIGGDEFLVICPDTDVAAVLLCGERLRSSVEAVAIDSGVVQLKGSISVGVATRTPNLADVDALIKTADQGVYLAKQRGRNCVASVQAESK